VKTSASEFCNAALKVIFYCKTRSIASADDRDAGIFQPETKWTVALFLSFATRLVWSSSQDWEDFTQSRGSTEPAEVQGATRARPNVAWLTADG
jgi:hypothetical protein